MGLIAEIVLTIFAWRNGWKGYALMPVGIAMTIGFMVGITTGGHGDTSWIALFDLGAIIALIVMCVKKPKPIVNNGEKIVDSNIKPE
jgi:uncharacterized membrane protein YfcA